jgi:hypothetical protein
MSTTNEDDKVTTTTQPKSPNPDGKSKLPPRDKDFPDPTQGDSGSSGGSGTKPA